MSAPSIEITELLRTGDAGAAAVRAVRRLVHAVAEWSPTVGLDVTFACQDGRRVLRFRQYGDNQPGWESDVAWALEDTAIMAPTQPDSSIGAEPAWTSVVEVHPTRAVRPSLSGFVLPTMPEVDEHPPHATAFERSQAELARQRVQARLRTPWPSAAPDALRETAELLTEHPDLLIRFRLSAATDTEVDMLTETMLQTWTGSDGDLYPYIGRPIRLRALLGSTSGSVPARARALARRWAVGLSVTPLGPREAETAWGGEVDSLYGHVVPEGVALSLLRLPTAGPGPFPGMATQHPRAKLRPLDPLPTPPSTPVRVGAATTVTGQATDASLDINDLVRHAFIEGQSGSGKSTLIAVLIREIIRQGYSCTFLDPHGTTIDLVLSELPESARETYVVRHEDAEHPMPLDIITGSPAETEIVIDNFAAMVQDMYDPKHTGIVGPRWRRWFGLLAQATQLVMGEAASLVAVTEIGSNVQLVSKLAKAVAKKKPALANALLSEIVNNKSAEAAEVQAWCVSKLHPVISTQMMRAILGTGHDAFDMRELMDEGRSVLVDLAAPTLGVQASQLLGALWLLKHQMAMGHRRNQRPHIIIVDEAHLFQYGSLPKLLAEGRKFGLGVVVATQYLGQLREDLAESLESNAGSLFTLSTGLPYAARSSIRLGDWPIGEIVRLPSLTAATSLYRNGARTEPFTLKIDHHQRMTAEGARDEAAAERGVDAGRRSRAQLWEPYRDKTVYDDAQIKRTLTAAAGVRPPEPRPTAKAPENFVDEWLAKRKAAQPINPKTAISPTGPLYSQTVISPGEPTELPSELAEPSE